MKPSDPDGAQHTDQFTSIKYNDGFKGQSESMTDFLYDFITLFPPLVALPPNDRTGKITENLILKSKFNVDDDDLFHPRANLFLLCNDNSNIFFIVSIVIKDSCR